MDLSTIHGPNYFILSMKAKEEVMSATHEVVKMEFSSSAERRSANQMAVKLHHLMGIVLNFIDFETCTYSLGSFVVCEILVSTHPIGDPFMLPFQMARHLSKLHYNFFVTQ